MTNRTAAAHDGQPVPTMLLDAVAVEEVPLSLWHRVLGEIGYPAGTSKEALSMESILDAVRQGTSDEQLIELLQFVYDVGTDSGVDAIKAVAEAHGHDLGGIINHAPREAAVEFWLAQRRDAELQSIFARVQMQTETRREPRAFREFRGKAPRRLGDWGEIEKRLRHLVAEWCRDEGYGDHVDVRGYVQDGDARIQIIHGYRLQKPLVVRDGEAGRATIEIRRVHCDIVRYDSDSAWLRVSPRTTRSDVGERYRRMLGEAFFGDKDHFSADIICSLQPLQEKGQALLDEASPHVVSAHVTELKWERGDEQKLSLKSPDCLAAAKELRLPLEEGELVEAKIRVLLVGRRTVRRTIKVKVPGRIEYDRDIHEVAIENFLLGAGIRHPEQRPSERDLWNLYPWRETEQGWRAAYLKDIDQLVADGILRPIDLASVRHPDHPHAGRALEPIQVWQDGADTFAVSHDGEVPPRLLTVSDTAGLALVITDLCKTIASRFGLTGGPSDLGDGIYFLGTRSFDGVQCAVALLARSPMVSAEVIGHRLRSAAHGAQLGVLVPVGRSSKTALLEIPFGSLLQDSDAFWSSFIRQAGLAQRLPAILTAHPDARLVVDKARQLVWLDRTLIALPPDSHAYQLVEMLAEAGGQVVPHSEIRKRISAARGDEGNVARKAKAAAKKFFEQSLSSADRHVDVNVVLVGVRRGYRLGVPAHVA